MVVVSVDGDLPVVDALGETDVAEDYAVVRAPARQGHVVVFEDDVGMGCPWVRLEPCNCWYKKKKKSQ